MFKTIGNKTVFDQTFRNSMDYMGVINSALTDRFTACATSVSRDNHRFSTVTGRGGTE